MLTKKDLYKDILRYNNELSQYLYLLTIEEVSKPFIDVQLRRDAIETKLALTNSIKRFQNSFSYKSSTEEKGEVRKIERNLNTTPPISITNEP